MLGAGGPVERRAGKSVWPEQGKWVKRVRNKVRVRLQRKDCGFYSEQNGEY